MKDLLTGLKKSGRVEVLMIAYGYQWETNLPWAKSELLKLGFVQKIIPSGVRYSTDPNELFCRECDRKDGLDLQSLNHVLCSLEYEQATVRLFSRWQKRLQLNSPRTAAKRLRSWIYRRVISPVKNSIFFAPFD